MNFENPISVVVCSSPPMCHPRDVVPSGETMKEGDQGGHLPPALHIIDKAATPATEALQGPPESPTRQPTPQHIFTLQTWGLRLNTVLWGFRTGSSSEPPGPTLSKSTIPQSHLLDRGQVLVPPPLPSCYWPEVGVWSAEAASRVFRSLQVTHKPAGWRMLQHPSASCSNPQQCLSQAGPSIPATVGSGSVISAMSSRGFH